MPDEPQWKEEYTNTVIRMIESAYTTEYIRNYGLVDIVLNGNKTLLKWQKRVAPLSDDQLIKLYNHKTQ